MRAILFLKVFEMSFVYVLMHERILIIGLLSDEKTLALIKKFNVGIFEKRNICKYLISVAVSTICSF